MEAPLWDMGRRSKRHRSFSKRLSVYRQVLFFSILSRQTATSDIVSSSRDLHRTTPIFNEFSYLIVVRMLFQISGSDVASLIPPTASSTVNSAISRKRSRTRNVFAHSIYSQALNVSGTASLSTVEGTWFNAVHLCEIFRQFTSGARHDSEHMQRVRPWMERSAQLCRQLQGRAPTARIPSVPVLPCGSQRQCLRH